MVMLLLMGRVKRKPQILERKKKLSPRSPKTKNNQSLRRKRKRQRVRIVELIQFDRNILSVFIQIQISLHVHIKSGKIIDLDLAIKYVYE